MALLLGIDNGLTVTKAVIFAENGQVLATARRRVAQSMPCARHVERDMGDLWTQTAAAIAEAVASCGRPDPDRRRGRDRAWRRALPSGPAGAAAGAGILSLDSRAGDLAGAWLRDGTA
ncbi:FGGY family carbohydrate kinase, partial [Paracoccus aerius]|uniref:FGGY family carbohydrate kinase n=1 Tax=Paracoccus aerius TaxID=1915382 RepID=UPI00361B21DC